MKKLSVLFTCIACGLLSFQQVIAQKELSVPYAVTRSFEKKFKAAETSRWRKINDNYVTTFSYGQEWRDAYFNTEGDFRGVGRFITPNLLPVAVADKISTYSKFELLEVYQYECIENGLCFFVVLKNEKSKLTVMFNGLGQVGYSHKQKIKTPRFGVDLVKKEGS